MQLQCLFFQIFKFRFTYIRVDLFQGDQALDLAGLYLQHARGCRVDRLAHLLLGELLPDRLFRKKTSIVATDWRPEPATALALLDDADGLAAQGRFGEAIHLLLFRSIDDLSGRRPGAVRPALTSRDIANLDVLPSQPRAAFARLAQAVERAFFGGQPVGSDVFDAARRDYEAFAFDAGWR